VSKDQSNKSQVFGAYLRSRGLSFTAEREAVLRQILAGGSHFQADELYLRLAGGKGRPVSRATVYRTLSLLVDCGLVRKVAFVDRHSHYEHLFGHDHQEFPSPFAQDRGGGIMFEMLSKEASQ